MALTTGYSLVFAVLALLTAGLIRAVRSLRCHCDYVSKVIEENAEPKIFSAYEDYYQPVASVQSEISHTSRLQELNLITGFVHDDILCSENKTCQVDFLEVSPSQTEYWLKPSCIVYKPKNIRHCHLGFHVNGCDKDICYCNENLCNTPQRTVSRSYGNKMAVLIIVLLLIGVPLTLLMVASYAMSC